MLNILFDLLAILVLHMGVAGAAWATVLSQLISGILCFLYMRKQYDILKFEKDEMKFEGRQAIILCNMAFQWVCSTPLQQSEVLSYRLQ